MWVKQHVGMKSQVILTISCVRPNHSSLDNRVPEEYGGMKYGGECIWEYEIEGFWSTCEWLSFSLRIVVITIFSISIGVIFILILALYIYANKHRHEKRNSLPITSPVKDENKNPVVWSLLCHVPPLSSTTLLSSSSPLPTPFPHQSQHTNSHNAMTPIKTPSSTQTIPGTARTVIKHHSHTARVSHHSFRS